jgi:phage portal protein BeeE
MMDEFYKATMYPMIINIEQKLNYHLFKGYPNLCVRFDTKDFLKGAALDQMNFAVQGVSAGIITQNEAREYLNMPKMDGHDELIQGKAPEPMTGNSPQDTGGGGGNQKRRAAIGTT